MMSKTHIAIGVASALLITQPHDITSCLTAVIGGAVGGIMSDIDVRSNKKCRDALYGRLIALGLTIIALFIDFFIGKEIINYIISPERRIIVIIGAILFAISILTGMAQLHRRATHSLLALLIMSAEVYMICPILGITFAIGFASHLAIDLFNKKPILLFYPLKKGAYFNLCYASKTANFVLMVVGTILSVVSLGYFLFRIFFLR